MAAIALHVNGKRYDVDVEPEQNLLGALRDVLDLTGTKYGCAQNECAACTVLVDGEAVKSCRASAHAMVGKEITTIEGLEQNGRLHPVQQAFLDAQALQCGYCTPGMIMSAVALLNERPAPTVGEIVRHMQGNICRCGTYARIVMAIQDAGARMRTDGTATAGKPKGGA